MSGIRPCCAGRAALGLAVPGREEPSEATGRLDPWVVRLLLLVGFLGAVVVAMVGLSSSARADVGSGLGPLEPVAAVGESALSPVVDTALPEPVEPVLTEPAVSEVVEPPAAPAPTPVEAPAPTPVEAPAPTPIAAVQPVVEVAPSIVEPVVETVEPVAPIPALAA